MDYQIKTLKYKGFDVFEKLEMKSFDRIPKLFREGEACFIFLEKGSFSIRTPDKFIDLSSGEGFLAKCFDYFFEMDPRQKKANDSLQAIGVLLFPEVIQEIFEVDLIPLPDPVKYNLKKVEIDLLLENFMRSIDILLENPELVDEQLVRAKIQEFVILISRTDHGLSQAAFLSNLFQKKEYEFKKTIFHNLYANLSLAELAHLCGMSESTFKRRFKEEFGESPIKYLNSKKLEKAATMLLSEDLLVSEIAYDCGFNTISSFNRAFKERYQRSPSDYRLDQSAQSLT